MTTPGEDQNVVPEQQPATEKPTRKNFISPTSSFVDFVELESEYITEEGRALARLYNPHKMRKIRKPITNFETCTHLLKGSIGAGILAMPKAFYNAGWAVGTVGTFVLGFICIYGIDVLIRSQYIQCKRLQVPFLTLPRSMRIAFLNGPKIFHRFAFCAPYFVDFFLIFYQLGICCAYIVFISESMRDIVKSLTNKEIDIRLYMLAILIPVVLINFIRNLKKLMPVSLIANCLIIVSFIGVFYFFFDGGFVGENVVPVASFSGWPLFMGTVMFSIEAVGVIVALEHNMKNPEQFLGWKGIFPLCMVFVILFYLAVGLMGYFKYGDKYGLPKMDTIIAVLPQTWASDTIRGIYALCIFGTYPLQCYVSLEIIWGNYLIQHIPNPNKECIVEYILRVIVVLITFAFALLIPRVDIVISLVGAFCLSFLGVIFPSLMELCTLWPNEFGPFRYILIKDCILIIIGIFILIAGTYCSVYELFK